MHELKKIDVHNERAILIVVFLWVIDEMYGRDLMLSLLQECLVLAGQARSGASHGPTASANMASVAGACPQLLTRSQVPVAN